jgi:hypothetical protein
MSKGENHKTELVLKTVQIRLNHIISYVGDIIVHIMLTNRWWNNLMR